MVRKGEDVWHPRVKTLTAVLSRCRWMRQKQFLFTGVVRIRKKTTTEVKASPKADVMGRWWRHLVLAPSSRLKLERANSLGLKASSGLYFELRLQWDFPILSNEPVWLWNYFWTLLSHAELHFLTRLSWNLGDLSTWKNWRTQIQTRMYTSLRAIGKIRYRHGSYLLQAKNKAWAS